MTGAVPAPVPVRLRELSLEDYAQVAALCERHGLGTRSAEEWRHTWVNNPAYHKDWPLGWVLENADGRIVGSIGSIPLHYEFQGRRIIAAAGRAWVADKEYRGYAVMLLDELFRQHNVDLFLNTTVNRHASPAYQLFDSPPVPAGRWDKAAFWITNYSGFARSGLAARGWKFASVLAWPAAAALRAHDLMRPGIAAGGICDCDVRFQSAFDDRFDVFWEQLREQSRQVLMRVRSRVALEWHFRYHLQRNNVWIVTASRGGRMLAYSIFYRKDKRDLGLKRLRFVDFQYVDSGQGTFRAMLARVLERCRRERIHMLEDLGCSIIGVQAPHLRALPSWLFHYKANGALAEALKEPDVWRPSLFDGDSSL